MTISILGADYISFYDYAKIKGLSVGSMINRAKKGKYNTAKRLGKKWYASRTELGNIYYQYGIPDSEDFITAREYAKINELVYTALIEDIKNGKYSTPLKYKATWYINKTEVPCSNIRDEYLTITEFAEQNNRTRKEIEKIIDSGKLKYFRKSPLGYIYIHKDEKLP